MNVETKDELNARLQETVEQMDDATQYDFLRRIVLLADCYRTHGNGSGVLLVRHFDTLTTIGINASYDDAKFMVLAAALSFQKNETDPKSMH
jgi:hypothetical protein